MKRQLYGKLKEWQSNPHRKPLLLQGARQVGKTYLLKEFASREYEDSAYFNFEQEPELKSIFERSLKPSYLIENLSAFAGKKIEPEKTLIFFDEIQVSPMAVTSLKYFCEEAPDYHVAAAGSLLGVSIGRETSFPVGKVNFMTLYPLNFFEYLEAVEGETTCKLLRDKNDLKPLPEIFHNKFIDLYKFYLFLGGMPEVVQNYLDNRDINNARLIQKEILLAYENDFSKYTTKSEAVRISEIWQSIPMQLARENKKFKYSDVVKGGRSSNFGSAIEWLRKTGMVLPSYRIKVPKIPMANYADQSKFKIYTHDQGLLGAMLGLNSKLIITPTELFSEFNGAFIENYVAAELVSNSSEKLYYWKSKSDAEVDFLISKDNAILPVEVKSGFSRKGKSLSVYKEKYKPANIYRISPRNFTQDNDFINIPLYAVSLLFSRSSLS